MKRSKLLVFMSGLAISTSCLPQICLGQTATGSSGASQNSQPVKFDELSNHAERGVRLDELFKSFQSAAQAAIEPVHPAKAKATTTASSSAGKANNIHKHPISKQAVLSKASQPLKPANKGNSSQPTVAAVEVPSKSNILAVSHSQSDLALVSATLDHTGSMPKYKAGEHMVINVQALTDCNVVVFDYDSKNTLTQLYPNQYETDGRLRAGQSIQIGGESSKYTLDVAGHGKEHIFVYSYPVSEAPITMAMAQIPHTPFRSAELTPEQYARFVRESRLYGHDRSVSVKAKNTAEPVIQKSDAQSNKVELTFEIEK